MLYQSATPRNQLVKLFVCVLQFRVLLIRSKVFLHKLFLNTPDQFFE